MVRDAPSNASPARTALPTAHFERNEAQESALAAELGASREVQATSERLPRPPKGRPPKC